MWNLIGIAVGGGIGSVLRYTLSMSIGRWSGQGFPWGTLAVNAAGCCAIGFLAWAFAGPWAGRDEWRATIVVGLLGGFTTFSAFSWESLRLAQTGHWGAAAGYVLATNALCLAGAWLGARAAQAALPT
jgi:CrcB protein